SSRSCGSFCSNLPEDWPESGPGAAADVSNWIRAFRTLLDEPLQFGTMRPGFKSRAPDHILSSKVGANEPRDGDFGPPPPWMDVSAQLCPYPAPPMPRGVEKPRLSWTERYGTSGSSRCEGCLVSWWIVTSAGIARPLTPTGSPV